MRSYVKKEENGYWITSWDMLLDYALSICDESRENLVAIEVCDGIDMATKMSAGIGPFRGTGFHAWTETRVYFSSEYGSQPMVCSVQRNPTPAVYRGREEEE